MCALSGTAFSDTFSIKKSQGGGGSVAYGTLILTPDGSVPVQNLKVNSEIIVYNVRSRMSTAATVIAISRITLDNLLTIHISDGMPLRVDVNPRLRFHVLKNEEPVLRPVTELKTRGLVIPIRPAGMMPITEISVVWGVNMYSTT